MAAFQQRLKTVGNQVGGMPMTAKLLIGALMVILMMSLVMVAAFTGRHKLVPLGTHLSPETQARAVSYLQANGIAHEVVGGDVLVDRNQKYLVLAQLTEGQVIGAEQINFDKLIAEDSPFLTRAQHRKRWLIAKMNVLSSLISSFQGIERATVVIDEPAQGGFGAARISPTASVQVLPRGELSTSQVEAIAHLVAGSHAGLDPTSVKVIDAKTGRSHQAPSEDQLASSNYLEIKRKIDKDTKTKLLAFLDYIPRVRVEVNAMVDSRAIEERNDAYEDPKIAPIREKSETRELIEQRAAMEPGVRPNTFASITPGTGTTIKLNEEKTDNLNEPRFSRGSQYIVDGRGFPLKINATIGVPRSWFVNRFRLDRGDPQANPDDQALKPIVEAETAELILVVEALIDTVALPGTILGNVVVDMIPDFIALGAGMSPDGSTGGSMGPGGYGPGGYGPGGYGPGGFGPMGPGSGGGAGGFLDGNLIRNLGLAGLALLALALMLMMVRKAGRVELPSPQEVAGVPPPLPTEGDAVVGEAEESDLALEGVELNEVQIRRQQMLNQISTMVKDDPDEVANLLRRWITIEA